MKRDMDERVAGLETPEQCEQFALNVADRLPDLALAARRRAIERWPPRAGSPGLPSRGFDMSETVVEHGRKQWRIRQMPESMAVREQPAAVGSCLTRE